jgi:hypothetical protein
MSSGRRKRPVRSGSLVVLDEKGYNWTIEKYRHKAGLVIEPHNSIYNMFLVMWPEDEGDGQHWIAEWRLRVLG